MMLMRQPGGRGTERGKEVSGEIMNEMNASFNESKVRLKGPLNSASPPFSPLTQCFFHRLRQLYHGVGNWANSYPSPHGEC